MPWGRTGAADLRNLGDSKGQQETARDNNLEVNGSQPLTWDAKPRERAFTQQRSQGL
jgi:hypothetical protein